MSDVPSLTDVLAATIAAVEAEGKRLLAEFYRPEGPRGSGSKAPIDNEIEDRLREALQRVFPCTFLGEESGETRGTIEGWTWSVDPHDATSDFLKGYRGSSISVGLLRGAQPVLGVVHAPASPDCGSETFAWAAGAGRLQRNGMPVQPSLRRRLLEEGEYVFTTTTSALRPLVFTRAVAPARFVALASIAHRMARVAAGDAVATISIHQVHEYDIAAGAALVNAAGGVVLDATGREVVFTGKSGATVNGCFAGAPEAAARLARFDWNAVRAEAKQTPRVALGFPKVSDPLRLARAQGCMLGLAIGGMRADAQPDAATELAIALARAIVAAGRYDTLGVLAAHSVWLDSHPAFAQAASNAALLRAAPIALWAAGDPARAARTAREDAALTDPDLDRLDACAAFAAAISTGVAGGGKEAMLQAALAHASATHAASRARTAIQRAAKSEAAPDAASGKSVFALHAAFRALMHAGDFVAAIAGGSAAGALFGAAHGIEAFPATHVMPVLACRPLAEANAPHPRPAQYWPDDVLELAEALLRGSK